MSEIAGYFHEGDEVKGILLELLSDKETKVENVYDDYGEKTGDKRKVIDFVGFLTDKNDKTYIFFPKHYRVENLEQDAKTIFECIQKHKQQHPDLYFGRLGQDKYESSYPFAAFYNIYKYFKTYGLFLRIKNELNVGGSGKINWKNTISKSKKYVINGNYIPFPIYRNKREYLYNFVTKCMIYAIDYTIDHFGFLVNEKKTGEQFPNDDIFSQNGNHTVIIANLKKVASVTFRDNEKNLINNLIVFFLRLKKGGNFYLKHHNFSSIWEEMVKKYLNLYFSGVDKSATANFSSNVLGSLGYKFKKKSFYPNLAKPKQSIQPDYYYDDGVNRYIFDAKYYNHISSMNYKQISYAFFLRNYNRDGNQSDSKTYSSLILPYDRRRTKIHFKMNPQFNIEFKDLIIKEEYIDIKKVINVYLKS